MLPPEVIASAALLGAALLFQYLLSSITRKPHKREAKIRLFRRYLHGLFHWQYSQFFIAGLFAAGVATLTVGRFIPAYTFFAVAGIWALVFWQVSDHLRKKAYELRKYRGKLKDKPDHDKRMGAYRNALRSYWSSNLLVSGVFLSLLIVLLAWTRFAQVEYELTDASQHISIDYSIPSGYKNNPLRSMFTITNNSGQDISAKHRFVCLENVILSKTGLVMTGMVSVQTNKGWNFGAPPPSPNIEELSPIKAATDGQTVSCLAGLELGPNKAARDRGGDAAFTCADITITFEYYLQKHKETLRKQPPMRIVTYETGDGGFQWYKQPLEEAGSHCLDSNVPH